MHVLRLLYEVHAQLLFDVQLPKLLLHEKLPPDEKLSLYERVKQRIPLGRRWPCRLSFSPSKKSRLPLQGSRDFFDGRPGLTQRRQAFLVDSRRRQAFLQRKINLFGRLVQTSGPESTFAADETPQIALVA